MWNISVWFPNTSAPRKISKTVFLTVCHTFLKIKLQEFFFLTGLSAWKCIDNFIYGFYTHNNTAFTAHVITNSTYLISHTRMRPPATSWPVIRNIATRLEMKVQEAVDIDGQMTLWLYIQLYNN